MGKRVFKCLKKGVGRKQIDFMKIIVIVVTYNGMKWYKNCFDSIRNSSIHADTIVIDNNSSDGTVQFIKDNYPEINLIESKVNLGFGKANNIGLKYAIEIDADFVFLLNQDAWVRPDTIEKLAVKLEENLEYGILSPVHLNGKENELDANFAAYIRPAACSNLISDFIIKGKAEDKIYPVKFVNAAFWMISKTCLLTIGGFDPVFPHYGEDDNYIGRVEYHGFRTGIYPKVYGVHDRTFKGRKSLKEIKDRKYIYHLIILTGIYMPFRKCIFRSFYYLFMESLGHLFHLAYKDIWINLCVSLRLIKTIPKILNNRRTSKVKGLSFLPEK